MVFADHVAETPAGKPLAPLTPEFEIPVAPTVAMVIELISVFTHTVGLEEGAAAVLVVITVIVPLALTVPHPPVNGIE